MLESTSKFELLSVFGVCEMYCIRIHLCYTKDSSTVSSISVILTVIKWFSLLGTYFEGETSLILSDLYCNL